MGNVIHVDFSRPARSEPDLQSTLSEMLAVGLRNLQLDRVDIADFIASECMQSFEAIDAKFLFQITLNPEVPAGCLPAVKQMQDQIIVQFKAQLSEINRTVVLELFKTAHGSAMTTARMLMER